MSTSIIHTGNIEVTDGVVTIGGLPITEVNPGPQGFNGTFPVGLQGPQGPEGNPQGPQGPQGPLGYQGIASGKNYIFVTATGTAEENALELQAAYNVAKLLSPSATNRITIISGPAYYNFDVDFVMDTQYIDLISLDGNRSIIFTGPGTSGTISITANNVFVKGVKTEKTFKIGDSLNLLRIENCSGGWSSFNSSSGTATVSGTFINCQGGAYSFGHGSTISGTFINCTGGDNSFGSGGGTASGTFIDCQGGDNSFSGSVSGTVSGTFTNCTGGIASFGYSGSATTSGTFINCQGGAYSFGHGSTISGTFINCTGGDNSFGYENTASGTFTNCVGGENSFGNGFGGTLTGKLYYCRLTNGTFQTVSGGGRTYYCVDGNGNTNNQ
jgi:hypothetical protein